MKKEEEGDGGRYSVVWCMKCTVLDTLYVRERERERYVCV